MQTFDASQTHARLPPAALIAALQAMLREGCIVPPRQVHAIADAAGAAERHVAGQLLLMTAWQPGRLIGVKTATVFEANGQRGLPSLHATYVLFDATTGAVVAQIDGAALTARRTACVSALAASQLARDDATRLLLVGAGAVASLLPAAMSAVRRIEQVAVWNHRRAGAEQLVQRLLGEGVPATVVDDLPAAVRQAHIVCCATPAREPLIRGEWLAPGCHVALIGGFTPQMREADGACLARARVFVDDVEALHKAGDLVQAMAEGAFARDALCGTLAQLCRNECRGRVNDSDITLFKSVGSAAQDLAAGCCVVGR